ncbi:unnamed protein product [Onchocerca flexuosa]|uniref:Sm domain-containing protein n=1 Tax=Onchocerca flexuosa TaxID=387005 RepID=A0A183H2T1_9BILA|nr:unnamed protein product [Onchocerca flexuosa]
MASLRSTELRRKRSANTMACLLQGREGSSVNIELKDYSVVQGILAHCDDAMNIEMKVVTIYQSKHPFKSFHCDNFYIQGKFIRFVHFDHYFNAAKIIHRSLNVRRKFGGSSGKRTC